MDEPDSPFLRQGAHSSSVTRHSATHSTLRPETPNAMSGSSIDWTLEFARARNQAAQIDAQPGLRGVSARLWHASEPWVVVVVTGVVTGAIASCLDILSAWLSDLRLGVCKDMWWMSRGLCCAGLDRTCMALFHLRAPRAFSIAVSLMGSLTRTAKETCRAWQTWGEVVANERHIVARALAQYSVYIALAVSPGWSWSTTRNLD